MSQGLPKGAGTAAPTLRKLADDYYVVCTQFATAPLFLPLVVGTDTLLIDAGISDTPERAVVPALNELGRSVESIALTALTHGHHDHFGGLSNLREMAPSMQVAVHRNDVRWVEDHERYWRELLDRFAPTIVTPDEDRSVVTEQSGRPTAVDRVLMEDDVLAVGGAADVVAISVHACHSPGSLAYFYPREGILATGDALQAHGTPFVDGFEAFPIYEDIAAYTAMLDSVTELAPRIVVDSHRGILEGAEIATLLTACREFPERFTHQLVEVLETLGESASLVEIGDAVQERFYPHTVRTVQLYLTTDLHLQELVRTGAAAPRVDDGVKSWMAAGRVCHHG